MIAWPSHLLSKHDSPQSIISKIACFNETTPFEFFQRFYEMPSCSASVSPNVRSWRDVSWMTDLTWRGQKEEPQLDGLGLKQLLLASTIREPALAMSSSYGVLKYCESCVKGGFHSYTHQYKFLERCPIHDAPLRSGCIRCGASIHFAIVPGEKGFWCGRCEWDDHRGWRRQEEFCQILTEAHALVESCPNLVIPNGSYASTDEHVIREPGALIPWLRPDKAHAISKRFYTPEPYGMSLHTYHSTDGALLHVVPRRGANNQLEFSLEVLELVEEEARKFIREFSYEHPCLGRAMAELMVVDRRSGRTSVIGTATNCPIAAGYAAWFRGAGEIVEALGSNRLGDGYSQLDGNLLDLGISLRTELHRCAYAAMRARWSNPKKYLCEVPAFDEIWRLNGISIQPSSSTSIRPRLEYGELFKEQPCIVEHGIRAGVPCAPRES